jgi:hypothetical protein
MVTQMKPIPIEMIQMIRVKMSASLSRTKVADITDPPALPLHRLRHAGFTRQFSIGRVQVLSTRIAQIGISTDFDASRSHRGWHSRVKGMTAVTTRDLNRILFSA